MGPYSERQQAQRRTQILKILARPNLKDDARRIWMQHLSRLATSEEQYNARVKAVYSNLDFGRDDDCT
jgi:gluconate kinase